MFDVDFCAQIGGYPKGSVLLSNDKTKKYTSLIDNNTSNFNVSVDPAKWVQSELTETEVKAIAWGPNNTAPPWVATGGSLINNNLTDGTRAGIGADLGLSNGYKGDLDGLTIPGEYYFKASTQADAVTKHAPSINAVGVQYGLVKVWRETADIVYQIFHGSNNELFIRYRSPAMVWTSWRHMMGNNNSVNIAGMYGAQSIGGGMIEQWGSAMTDPAGYININFPVAFPNECYGVHAMHVGGDVVSFCEMSGTLTTTGVRLRARDSQMAVASWLVRWRAIGH